LVAAPRVCGTIAPRGGSMIGQLRADCRGAKAPSRLSRIEGSRRCYLSGMPMLLLAENMWKGFPLCHLVVVISQSLR
jgi:hypothetical protein